ncbi:MFS transporter permease [Microbacterium sp. SSW1-59]|nr:MFS transporter permease [Microbacterium sp. SSW1-59]MDZ8201952.1 MFS transporter permease [Microbacterium sp. SSW1-59]
MWLRRGFFAWLIPAAVVLPVWLLVGWAVFDAGGWAFVWVLFLAMPSVFIGQLVLGLLARARGTVRAHRAVSWWDVAGFGLWHALIVSLGFFDQAWWAPVMVATLLVGVGLFWLQVWQLWREARPAAVYFRTDASSLRRPRVPAESASGLAEQDVFVIAETQDPLPRRD